MRFKFSLPAIVCVLFSYSQTHYGLFNSQSELFFRAGTGNPLAGLKPDSVTATGADTIYYHYRILDFVNTNSVNCQSAKAPNWTGIKTVQRANYDYIFYNQNNDSIVIKTAASAGATWTLCTLPSGDYFKASVISRQFEQTFDGNSDTVKTISIQAYNSSHAVIANPVNSLQIKIARTQGLIRSINFYKFPSNSGQYFRTFGKRLLKQELIDMQPGEVWQTYMYGANGSSGIEVIKTYTCVGRAISSSLNYTFNVYSHTKEMSLQGTTVTTNYTTQVMVINNPTTYLFTQMPGQFIPTNSSSGSAIRYYFDESGSKNCSFYIRLSDCIEAGGSTDTCMGPSVSCNTISWKNHYYKLGSYYNEMPGGLGGVTINSYPLYHSTSTYTCGAYNTVGLSGRDYFSDIRFYPNPATESFVIKGEKSEKIDVIIYDICGRACLNNSVNINEPVDIGFLKAGIYFVRLSSGTSSAVKKLIKQ